MRATAPDAQPTTHAALTNVTADQHHPAPQVISFSNTTAVIPPLPGGPYVLDVAVPFDTQAVIFSLRSPHVTEGAGGCAGVTGIADRNSLNTSTVSIGGHGTLVSASYNAIYSRAGAALNLSHKVFDSTLSVSLTNACLVATGPSTRVLRLEFTNYSASNQTLSVYGEAGLL